MKSLKFSSLLNNRGQTMAVVPVVMAVTLAGAMYWNYHSSIMNFQAQGQKGSTLGLFNQLVEARLRTLLESPNRDGWVAQCASELRDLRNRVRNFDVPMNPWSKTWTAPEDSETLFPASSEVKCLLGEEDTKGLNIQKLKIEVSHMTRSALANQDSRDGMRNILIKIRSELKGPELVTESKVRLKVRHLKDYALVLPESKGFSSFYAANGDSIALVVSGNVAIIDEANQPPNDLFYPQKPWLYFDGLVYSPHLAANFMNRSTMNTEMLSKIFIKQLIVSKANGPHVLGENIRTTVLPNQLIQEPFNLTSIPVNGCELGGDGFPWGSNANSQAQVLDFSQAKFNDEQAMRRVFCGVIKTPSLTVNCPSGKFCRVYAFVSARRIVVNGGGKVLFTNPSYHLGLGAGPMTASQDTLWRSIALATIQKQLKSGNQLTYYEPMMSRVPATPMLNSPDNYIPVFNGKFANNDYFRDYLYLDSEAL